MRRQSWGRKLLSLQQYDEAKGKWVRVGLPASCSLFSFLPSVSCVPSPGLGQRPGAAATTKGGYLPTWLLSFMNLHLRAAQLAQGKVKPPIQSSRYLCSAITLGFLPSPSMCSPSVLFTKDALNSTGSNCEGGWWPDSRLKCVILRLGKVLFLSGSVFSLIYQMKLNISTLYTVMIIKAVFLNLGCMVEFSGKP